MDPQDPFNYHIRSLARYRLKDYAGALKDENENLQQDPNSLNSLINKVLILTTCPDPAFRSESEASFLVLRALKKYPNDGYIKSVKACLLALQGDYETAIQWQADALEDPLYAADSDLCGGTHAPARITAWKSRTLWLSTPK